MWIFKKINKVFFKNLDNLFSKYWLNYFKSSKYIFRIAFSIRPIGFQITSNCWNSFFRIAFSIRPIGFHSLDEVIKKLLSVQAWCYQAWCYYLWLSLEVSRDSSVVASSTTQTCQQEDVGSNLGLSGEDFFTNTKPHPCLWGSSSQPCRNSSEKIFCEFQKKNVFMRV